MIVIFVEVDPPCPCSSFVILLISLRSVRDTNDRSYMIKKVSNAFQDPFDAKMCLREIKVMKELNHENVSDLLGLI
jgi:hypothetical protein